MKTIPLSRGMCAIVDDEDYEELSKYTWCVTRGKHTFYAARNAPKSERVNGKRRTIFMHKVIAGVDRAMRVDHRDGNGLNNVRSNLRPATNSQNMMNTKLYATNTSGHAGVTFTHRNGRGAWRAQIVKDYKHIFLGYHDNMDDAIAARKEGEIRYFGEYRSQRRRESVG